MRVDSLGRSVAVVDDKGRATNELAIFFEAVSKLPILIGTGSPEGVVEALETRLYMDSAGTTGTILYIKQFNDVLGDRKLGWILV